MLSCTPLHLNFTIIWKSNKNHKECFVHNITINVLIKSNCNKCLHTVRIRHIYILIPLSISMSKYSAQYSNYWYYDFNMHIITHAKLLNFKSWWDWKLKICKTISSTFNFNNNLTQQYWVSKLPKSDE